MPNQVCKAAVCAGGCLDDIVIDEVRELTEVAVKLAAGGHLTVDQLDEIVVLYTRYADEVDRRRKADFRLKTALAQIIPEIGQ